MKITPTNPNKINAVRNIPTVSLKTTAAARVTVMGNICRIAVTFANGICMTAVRKK